MSYIYYNIEIFNETSNFKLAKFNETRVVPILNNPSKYDLSIVRFTIPSQTIPILIWPGDNIYKITITWLGQEVSAFLTLPYNEGVPEYGNAIYNYQELCDSINLAFENCYAQLSVLFPGPYPATEDWVLYTESPPYIIFNNITNFFSIQVPYSTADYTDPPIGQPSLGNWGNIPFYPDHIINIYYNEKLGSLLKGFEYKLNIYNNDKYYNLLIKNNNNNIIPIGISVLVGDNFYYNMTQSYPTLININDFDNIIFRTSSVPVSNELVGAQRNVLQQILTDFEISEQNYDNSNIQYFPVGPIRYYPLLSNSEMRTIDMQVFWKNRAGDEFQLYLAPNTKLTVKIQFRKRTEILLRELMYNQEMQT